MSQYTAILKQLSRSKNMAVEGVIAGALQFAAGEEQAELFNVMVERNQREGWVILVRIYDKLPETLQAEMRTHPADLFGALSEAMQDTEGAARANVISIVQQMKNPACASLLAEALNDVRDEIRQMAGAALLEMVKAFNAQGEEDSPAQEKLRALRRAAETVVRQYKNHRQPEALLAALLLEREQDGALWVHFQDPYEDATQAAGHLLRDPRHAELGRTLYLALASPLKAAAMAGIAGAEKKEVAEGILEQSFRAVDPRIRLTLETMGAVKALKPDVLAASTLDNWAERLRLILALGMQPIKRLELLLSLLTAAGFQQESAAWKMSVAQAIAETGLAPAGEPLGRLCMDADERVARFAARALLRKPRLEWREFAAAFIPSSPHASVQAMAPVQAPREVGAFASVWRGYQKMPPAIQHSSVRAAAIVPASMELLKEKLASEETTDVAQGLKMLNTLPDLSGFRQEILGLCGNHDSRIVAICVRLLGRLEDPSLKELLEKAAQHSDPRVRANAVESMEALHVVDKSQHVLGMLNSRFNRERANAIKAIGQFDFATSRDCLTRMLADPNPAHRISALWVVGQIKMLDVVRQVSSIARRDPNPRVRRRAQEMVESINGVPMMAMASGD